MSEPVRNPFKKDILRRQFDACVLCYFTRHKDLFRPDGSRHTGNGVANSFWWGFDGVRTPEQWDGSRDTPAYASYRAGELIAAFESALAAKDAEIEKLSEARDLISDWLIEGTEDLPDDTPVTIKIGDRSIILDELKNLRAALKGDEA